jgi:hypothetical protein
MNRKGRDPPRRVPKMSHDGAWPSDVSVHGEGLKAYWDQIGDAIVYPIAGKPPFPHSEREMVSPAAASVKHLRRVCD